MRRRSTLPTLSVIIPFYNEALVMLLRTVHSVLERTPADLLVDVILVNDHSLNADINERLPEYVKLLPDKVRLKSEYVKLLPDKVRLKTEFVKLLPDKLEGEAEV